MTLSSYLYSALLAGFCAIVIIPFIILLSHKNGWFDTPNERKIHKHAIPRLGGIAIFWSFLLTLVMASLFILKAPEKAPWGPVFWSITVATICVHLVGLADDFKNLKARYKLAVQLAAACLVAIIGFRFDTIFVPFVGAVELGWFSYPLTIIWIVGISNAINMIDGLDGLSGGISIIAAFSFAVMFNERGQDFPALMAFVLVGSIAGYLFYNFPPAKIFMGDSGSTFIGFTLAVMPLMGRGMASGMWFWDSITILLIPIFDTFAAMIRRWKAGVSVMSADKRHLHHKLMDIGFGARPILAIVYAAGMLLGAVAASSLYLDPLLHWVIVIATWLVFLGLFTLLHFLKERSFRLSLED
jgi:UDP-GlcNAc:undecaprenyl-phosphate GlcNAc-1-phosphate transferase